MYSICYFYIYFDAERNKIIVQICVYIILDNCIKIKSSQTVSFKLRFWNSWNLNCKSYSRWTCRHLRLLLWARLMYEHSLANALIETTVNSTILEQLFLQWNFTAPTDRNSRCAINYCTMRFSNYSWTTLFSKPLLSPRRLICRDFIPCRRVDSPASLAAAVIHLYRAINYLLCTLSTHTYTYVYIYIYIYI